MQTIFLEECPNVQIGYQAFNGPSEKDRAWLTEFIAKSVAKAEQFLQQGAGFEDQIAWVKENTANIDSLNYQKVQDDGRMLWFSVRHALKQDAREVADRHFQYQVELRVKSAKF